MTEIQQNRYDQLIRRVNNIVSAGSMVGDALNELFPTIDVENVPGELLALLGTRIGLGGSSITGVAAEFAKAQLFNPADSNLIVAVTGVRVSVTTTSIITWGTTDTLFTSNPDVEVVRDTRGGASIKPTASVRILSDGTVGPANMPLNLLANSILEWTDPNAIVVLAPGTGVTFTNTNSNVTTQFTFMWRERNAEAAELNF